MDLLFWFKKILSFHLHPLPLALDLLLLAWLFTALGRRRDRRAAVAAGEKRKSRAGGFGLAFLAGGILVLYLSSIPAVAVPLVYSLEKQYAPLDFEAAPGGNPEFVVVLSVGERFHPQKPASSLLTPEAYLRVAEGVRVANHFSGAGLVLTGSPREVNAMHRTALSLGIDDRRIVEETNSRDTKDHARRLKDQLAGKEFILVTSGTHMPRSMSLFAGQGLTPVAAPCDLWEWPGWDHSELYWWRNYLPSTSSLHRTQRAVHEFLGLGWARLLGQSAAGEDLESGT